MPGFLLHRPGARQEKAATTAASDYSNCLPNGSAGANIVGTVPEVRVDDHARHPLGKQWTRKSRSKHDAMHTG